MTDRLALVVPEELVEQIALLVLEMLDGRAAAVEPASPYLTVEEAAGFLRCERQRVYDLLSSRRLTRHKDGRRTLISRAEVEAHVRNGGA
jgi:excisionase family DNA binding protein